ncbi:MAG: Pectinesterase [Anaerocolumna sp.]|jgi:pectinesterase|nr:Pectinesterase [Anaerocolumna sp.]
MKRVVLKVGKTSGSFATIGEALTVATQFLGQKVNIEIEPGVYREKLVIKQDDITLSGKNPKDTIITYGQYATEILEDNEKRGTFRTASVFVDGNDFTARNLTFENSSGPGTKVGQAIALYVDGDKMTFHNCRLLGGQDTLFTAPLPQTAYEKNGFRGPKEFAPRVHGRHWYKECFISGDVDFIFGGATAYFDECEIFSKYVNQDINGYVTAASTEAEVEGYVFNQCNFTSNCPPRSVYLGRPWRNHGKVAILNSYIGEHIIEEGWHDWGKTDARNTVCFSEYNNRGLGSDTKKRPEWVKLLTEEEALKYTKDKVLGDWMVENNERGNEGFGQNN